MHTSSSSLSQSSLLVQPLISKLTMVSVLLAISPELWKCISTYNTEFFQGKKDDEAFGSLAQTFAKFKVVVDSSA